MTTEIGIEHCEQQNRDGWREIKEREPRLAELLTSLKRSPNGPAVNVVVTWRDGEWQS